MNKKNNLKFNTWHLFSLLFRMFGSSCILYNENNLIHCWYLLKTINCSNAIPTFITPRIRLKHSYNPTAKPHRNYCATEHP